MVSQTCFTPSHFSGGKVTVMMMKMSQGYMENSKVRHCFNSVFRPGNRLKHWFPSFVTACLSCAEGLNFFTALKWRKYCIEKGSISKTTTALPPHWNRVAWSSNFLPRSRGHLFFASLSPHELRRVTEAGSFVYFLVETFRRINFRQDELSRWIK